MKFKISFINVKVFITLLILLLYSQLSCYEASSEKFLKKCCTFRILIVVAVDYYFGH